MNTQEKSGLAEPQRRRQSLKKPAPPCVPQWLYSRGSSAPASFKALFTWMQANKWIYKRPGASSWLGYQDRVQAGLLEHKTDIVKRGDGTEKVAEQVRVTPKGLAKLAEAFNENPPAVPVKIHRAKAKASTSQESSHV